MQSHKVRVSLLVYFVLAFRKRSMQLINGLIRKIFVKVSLRDLVVGEVRKFTDSSDSAGAQLMS